MSPAQNGLPISPNLKHSLICYHPILKYLVLALTGASQVVLVVKNLPASVGDTRNMGSIPGLGRNPRVGNGNPLQHSCLENSMGRVGYSPWGHKELDTIEHAGTHLPPSATHTEHLCFIALCESIHIRMQAL